MMRILALSILLIPCLCIGQGPYAPPAGQPGTTAMSKDSSAFVAWGGSCQVVRGYYDIAQKDSTVNHGNETDATGMADGSVVSLGDSGFATVSFAKPIHNGPGPDFAVFENSFTDDYLELAFVEVSSDGVHFVRFPSVSLTPVAQQTGPFGSTDATNIYNLAGKYRGGFGTPFDLNELKDSSSLNINRITHVRIVDVIGTVDTSLCSFDSQGNPVNDPYPTLFASGGFDLDAVGVIHFGEIGLKESVYGIEIYPNPAQDFMVIENPGADYDLSLTDISGNPILREKIRAHRQSRINLEALPRGVYILHLGNPEDHFSQKIVLN